MHTSTSQHTMVRVQILYREMIHQVPHSSILGPVLYLLYANVFLCKKPINGNMKMPSNNLTITNTERAKTRSSSIAHNTNPLRPQVKIESMDIAHQLEPNLLSLYITEKI